MLRNISSFIAHLSDSCQSFIVLDGGVYLLKNVRHLRRLRRVLVPRALLLHQWAHSFGESLFAYCPLHQLPHAWVLVDVPPDAREKP
jgi:hypothetical protein